MKRYDKPSVEVIVETTSDRKSFPTDVLETTSDRKPSFPTEDMKPIPTEDMEQVPTDVPTDVMDELRQEDKTSIMYGRIVRKISQSYVENIDGDDQRRLASPMIGNVLLERNCEMHAADPDKHALLLTTGSEMLCQSRSTLGGRVVKNKRGTPSKQHAVMKHRKMFENPSSPASTRGPMELLLQSTRDYNQLILGANQTSAEHSRNRASQSDERLGTGPRQASRVGFRPEPDWSIRARGRLDSQSRCKTQTWSPGSSSK